MQALRVWFNSFQPDWRSLAAFRITLALGLTLDLAQRYANARYFYGEQGILPLSLWEKLFGDRAYYWTLHFAGGSERLFMVLLLIQLGLALSLLFGVYPRWVAWFSWLLMLSLVLRNPLLFYGGDKLATLLLLIAVFLPLSRKNNLATSAGLVSKLSFLWLMVQMAVLYIASGVSKLGSIYWQDGSALSNVLNMNMLVRPAGVWFGNLEFILRPLSILTPWAEIILPLLFFVPLGQGRVRLLAVACLLVLNCGIQLMLDVGFFMFYASAGLLALLPSVFWDGLAKKLHGRSWLESLTRLCATRKGLQRSIKQSENMAPLRGKLRVTALSVVMLSFMGVMVATGLESMKVFTLTYPSWGWTLIRGLNMYQNWGLFTNPHPTSVWYVSKAKLADGTWVDILQSGKPVVWDRQKTPNALFAQNSKWRVAIAKINALDEQGELREAFMRNLAAKWTHEHQAEKAVVELTMYELRETNPGDVGSQRDWKKWAYWAS